MSDSMIDVCGLHHNYGRGPNEVEVLHGIDLRISRGEFVAVMGPSGCGKTTLLHILGLMARPTRAASLRMGGVETVGLSDAGRTRLRYQQVGFVFQRFNLIPVISAIDNIRLAFRLRGENPDGQPERMLDRVGLAGLYRRKPGQLSIGQQQRVAIARAMAVRPALLLADEPTGNLDSEIAEHVMDLLAHCHRAFGQTVVLVTHNEAVARRASRVLYMRDGRIRER